MLAAMAINCRNSRLLMHCFSQQSKPFLRNISLLQKVSKPALLNKSQYRIIYHFPYIPLIGAVMKTKVRVPAVSVALCPLLYFLDDTKVSIIITIITAGIYFFTGRLLSKLTKNTVGKMYVNKEGEITNVIISSVDESGRRIDRIHDVNDIFNADFPTAFARYLGFLQLGVENSDVYYNFNISNCKFIDEKACDYVLGARFGPLDLDLNEVKENEDEDIKKQLKQ